MITVSISKAAETGDPVAMGSVSRALRTVASDHNVSMDVRPHRHITASGEGEDGATVILYSDSLPAYREAWITLRDTFGLTCAYVTREGYSGCVLEDPANAGWPVALPGSDSVHPLARDR